MAKIVKNYWHDKISDISYVDHSQTPKLFWILLASHVVMYYVKLSVLCRSFSNTEIISDITRITCDDGYGKNRQKLLA